MVSLTRAVLFASALVASTSAIPVARGDTRSVNLFTQTPFDSSAAAMHVYNGHSDSTNSVVPPVHSASNSRAIDSKLLWSPQRLAIFLPTRYVYFFKIR
ncbi:hypothetical protein BDY19DRAFT_992170 [Irpex rosettiformis]|uniref:Uncharacterized protein n=1 Tax=Irpex rosettiformis TaxID=378272 RepID=A0ACB8U933_9APHY|nr:hypothetical protein BDY19DRAFT_992170 [Irpex rosettiformis]